MVHYLYVESYNFVYRDYKLQVVNLYQLFPLCFLVLLYLKRPFSAQVSSWFHSLLSNS